MKFKNENSKEQMTYVAPRVKDFNVRLSSALLNGSDGVDVEDGDIDTQNGWF